MPDSIKTYTVGSYLIQENEIVRDLKTGELLGRLRELREITEAKKIDSYGQCKSCGAYKADWPPQPCKPWCGLEHGRPYEVNGRNFKVAIWDAGRQCFMGLRNKFNHISLEPEYMHHHEDRYNTISEATAIVDMDTVEMALLKAFEERDD